MQGKLLKCGVHLFNTDLQYCCVVSKGRWGRVSECLLWGDVDGLHSNMYDLG
jgi:hypothetical protein